MGLKLLLIYTRMKELSICSNMWGGFLALQTIIQILLINWKAGRKKWKYDYKFSFHFQNGIFSLRRFSVILLSFFCRSNTSNYAYQEHCKMLYMV